MSNPTAISATLPVQIALYNRLEGVLSVPVVDGIPEDLDYPYVVIGEVTEVPEDTHDGYGSELTAVIHVWTEAEGFQEALEIAGEIRSLLNRQHDSLQVEGHTCYSIQHQNTRTMRDPNPRIRHCPVTYLICTYQDM